MRKGDLFFRIAMVATLMFFAWAVLSPVKIKSVTYLGKCETISLVRGGWNQPQGYIVTIDDFKYFSKNPFIKGDDVYLIKQARSRHKYVIKNYNPIKEKHK